MVRRIFRRFAETRSFYVVAAELNRDGIPALVGGFWHDRTIRRMLTNESYAGRLYLGQTRWVAGRDARTGKRRRRPTGRPAEEWVLIEGASPRIVDEPLWGRVQEILNDPERLARCRPARYEYPLRGRVRCESAMMGQTMRSKGRAYHYYCCTVAFGRRPHRSCPARNVRADKLEAGLWREVRAVLTDPRRVLAELQHQQRDRVDPEEIAGIERQLAVLANRERRLVRLFTYGEIDEEVVREEGGELNRQRELLESRLRELRRACPTTFGGLDPDRLARVCAAIREWLDKAGAAERVQVLEALQIAIRTTPEAATVSGVLPSEPPGYLLSDVHRHDRRSNNNRAADGVPFRVTIAL